MKIILISGFGKPDILWGYFYKELKKQGHHTPMIFNYHFRSPLEESLARLERFIAKIKGQDPECRGEGLNKASPVAAVAHSRVVVIGHSMGGLLAARCRQADYRIAIASPLLGTELANYFPSALASSTRDMRPGSNFINKIPNSDYIKKIESLEKDEENPIDLVSVLKSLGPLLTVSAGKDNLIRPSNSAIPDYSTKSMTFENDNHISILFNKQVLEAIKAFIKPSYDDNEH